MRHLTEPLPSMISSEQLDTDLRNEVALHDSIQPVEVFADVQQHLAPGNLDVEYAHHKLEELPPEHAMWRLEALNGIYINGKDRFNQDESKEVQAEILDATYSLVARRLPMTDIVGTGLPAVYIDEANSYSSVTLKSLYLVAQAWDNTGRTEQLEDYIEKMIDRLDEANTDSSTLRNEERATFYKALYTGMTFHEAHLEQLARGNEMSVYTKLGQKLIRLYSDNSVKH